MLLAVLAIELVPVIAEKYLRSVVPEVETRLASAMNADIHIEKISAGLFPLPAVIIYNLKAVRNGAFQFEAGEIRLDIDAYRLIRREQPVRRADITGGKGSFSLNGKAHTLEELSFSSSIRQRENTATMESPSLSMNLDGTPVNFTALSSGTLYPEFTPSLEGMEVQAGSVLLKGQFKQVEKGFQLSLSTASTGIQDLFRLISPYVAAHLPRVDKGVLSFSMDAVLNNAGDISAQGDIAVSSFSSQQNNLQFSSLKASGFQISLTSDSSSASGFFDLRDLGIADGIDRYHTGRTVGKITLKSSRGNLTASSDALKVENFGFRDDTTALDNVTADLQSVQVNGNPKGYSFSLNLAGGPIHLSHPNITISGARSIRSPITVEIPAAGGYMVKGPVTIDGASLSVLGNNLENTSGHADMLVSGPLKRFESADLSGEAGGRNIKAKTIFSMVPDEYQFEKTSFELAGGAASGFGILKRGSNGSFSLHIEAEKFPAHEAAAVFGVSLPASSQVLVDRLNTSLKCRKPDYLHTLSGEGSFHLLIPGNGGLGLAQGIAKFISTIPFVQVGSRKAQETDKESVSSDVRIVDGTATFTDFSLLRNMYTFRGSGTMDADLNVNGRGDLVLIEVTSDMSSKRKGSLSAGISIPLVIKGPLKDVQVSTDKPELLKGLTGLSLVERAAKGTVNAGKAITGAIGSALGGSEKKEEQEGN